MEHNIIRSSNVRKFVYSSSSPGEIAELLYGTVGSAMKSNVVRAGSEPPKEYQYSAVDRRVLPEHDKS